MRLTRLDEMVTYKTGNGRVTGRRGYLVIGPAFWPTIENWDVDTKLLPGVYQCEHAYWTAKTGTKARAIRVRLTPAQFEIIYPEARRIELTKQVGDAVARARIYVHPANYPHQLEGCISPGLKAIDRGVEHSVRAMTGVFDALGGFEVGRKLELEVA